MLWCVIVLLLPALRAAFKERSEIALCFLPLVYQFFIETASESGPRHPLSYNAIIVLLIAVSVDFLRGQSARSVAFAGTPYKRRSKNRPHHTEAT
jgi:hypothetical protein